MKTITIKTVARRFFAAALTMAITLTSSQFESQKAKAQGDFSLEAQKCIKCRYYNGTNCPRSRRHDCRFADV